MVGLITPLPNAVIRDAVRPSDVVDQVLNEIGFVPTPDHGTSAPRQLTQLEKKQRCGIELQVTPSVVVDDGIPRASVVFRMECIQRIQACFEAFNLVRLAQHGAQQTAHESDDVLLQFPGSGAAAPITPTVGEGESPDALDGVHTVANPGIAVVAMDGVCRTGGQQATNGILSFKDHPLDRSIESFKNLIATAVVLGEFRRRQNHAWLDHHF
jgi:hypothetical protein